MQQRQNIADLVGVVDKLEGEMKELKARIAKLESAKKIAEEEAANARKANSGFSERFQPLLHETYSQPHRHLTFLLFVCKALTYSARGKAAVPGSGVGIGCRFGRVFAGSFWQSRFADSGRNTDLHCCCAEEELAAAAASEIALKVRTLCVPVLYGRCTACSSLPYVRWLQPCHAMGPSGPCMPCMSEYPPEWPPLKNGT